MDFGALLTVDSIETKLVELIKNAAEKLDLAIFSCLLYSKNPLSDYTYDVCLYDFQEFKPIMLDLYSNYPPIVLFIEEYYSLFT